MEEKAHSGLSGKNGDAGIVAMQVYFPSSYVLQEELEQFDGVSSGKYTIGLGQHSLAFCSDREDVYSVSLSAVALLMESYGISYKDVGRLEVATETIMDHSKAVKTVLMQLFAESGNTDVEGIDCMNACYAGTNALFNSVAWVESRAWDGRYAVVVCADIAEYAAGPARPTGGAGAVAFLIGPNAPLILSPVRASHMEHVYDFYKPHLSSPYPVVDGHFSQTCYLRALDTCYQRLVQKWERASQGQPDAVLQLSAFSHIVFHAPYNKLVQKSFGRLVYNDFIRFRERDEFKGLQEFHTDTVPTEASYSNSALEKAFVKHSKPSYDARVVPSTQFPRFLGNLYTASIYAGLASLVSAKHSELCGSKLLMFSYGSGLASSAFVLCAAEGGRASAALNRMRDVLNLQERLDQRTKCTPEQFVQHMTEREKLHGSAAFVPKASIDTMAPGSFYLVEKDDTGKRRYERVPTKRIVPTTATASTN